MLRSLSILALALAMVLATPPSSFAEDAPQFLSTAGSPAQSTSGPELVNEAEFESQLLQVHSELRSQRDLADLRMNTLENEIKVTSAYVEKLIFTFMVAGGIVVLVVLITLNKQSSVNNERMRNLIREAESALDDLHRLMDRPEAEHFHVSRKLSRIMNKLRERENPSLPQKEISDIFAASEDPTLPVSLHLQANALRCEQRGDWSNAIHFWEKLLTIDDTSPEVLLHLAQNYKRLAQVSGVDKASRMREVSLDYFQKYSVRTNLHTHSERELRKMASLGLSQGPVSRLHAASEPVDEAPGHAQVAESIEKQPAAPQPRTLSIDEYQKAKATPKPKPVKKRKKSVTESLLAINSVVALNKPFGKRTVQQAQQTSPAQPQVAKVASSNGQDQPKRDNEIEKLDKEGEAKAEEDKATRKTQVKAKPKVVRKGNGDAMPTKAATESLPASQSQAGTESKKAEATKEVKTDGLDASAALMPSNGNGGNGEAPTITPTASNKPQDQKVKAYKSRMDKAREHFSRYSSAKTKKDRLVWLNAASDEFQEASRYDHELELYRLWGTTVIELATIDDSNKAEHVERAVKIFNDAEKYFKGEFCNEVSLCHAILDNEEDCRKSLEQARDLGKFNSQLFEGLPYFEKYKSRQWFQELAESTNV